MDFNPRSREGSDILLMAPVIAMLISIHAPVKGATHGPHPQRGRREISIHAPVKGATGTSGASMHRSVDFNPRSREGSDSRPTVPFSHIIDFNPRSREGSDEITKLDTSTLPKFQSTLP